MVPGVVGSSPIFHPLKAAQVVEPLFYFLAGSDGCRALFPERGVRVFVFLFWGCAFIPMICRWIFCVEENYGYIYTFVYNDNV